MCFKLRLSFWQQLPWVLFGRGHHEAETAAGRAQRALQLWEASSDLAGHHPLSVQLCMPGTATSAQTRLFASRQAELGELPRLHMAMAKLRFA